MIFLRRGFTLPSLFLAALGLVPSCGTGDSTGNGDGDGDDALGGRQDGDGDGDTDGDGDGTPATFCRSDKECRASGGICDTSLSTCVDCKVDADCDSGQQCRRSSCVEITPCSSSKDCPLDEICSGELGFCVNCEGNNDCAAGQSCVYFSCLTSCKSDKDCSAEDGVCNTGEGVCLDCFRSSDCKDGSYCNVVGDCVERICAEDETFCDGDTLVSCNEDGSGYLLTECTDACKNGKCTTLDCVTGDEGCPCYGNDTCNDGLVCVSALCIDESSGSDGTSNGSGGASSGSGGAAPGTGGSGGGVCPDLIIVADAGAIECGGSVVDNFDDNDLYACPSFSGTWQAINGSRSVSEMKLNMTGSASAGQYGGVYLDPLESSIDLSSYTGIEFKASGALNGTLGFAMQSANSYEGMGHISYEFQVSIGSALTYRVPFCHLRALSTHPSAPPAVDLTKVYDIQFLSTGTYDITIDSIRYY